MVLSRFVNSFSVHACELCMHVQILYMQMVYTWNHLCDQVWVPNHDFSFHN